MDQDQLLFAYWSLEKILVSLKQCSDRKKEKQKTIPFNLRCNKLLNVNVKFTYMIFFLFDNTAVSMGLSTAPKGKHRGSYEIIQLLLRYHRHICKLCDKETPAM